VKLQSRMTVFAAIGGMLALMAAIVYYASLDNEALASVEILSGTLEVDEVDSIAGRARLSVTLDVRNPSETTFTIPSITYDITAGGEDVASGEYSAVDVAMPGRVVFTTGETIPLRSIAYMARTGSNAALYDAVVSGAVASYEASGTVTVESAWSIVEAEYRVGLGGS